MTWRKREREKEIEMKRDREIQRARETKRTGLNENSVKCHWIFNVRNNRICVVVYDDGLLCCCFCYIAVRIYMWRARAHTHGPKNVRIDFPMSKKLKISLHAHAYTRSRFYTPHTHIRRCTHKVEQRKAYTSTSSVCAALHRSNCTHSEQYALGLSKCLAHWLFSPMHVYAYSEHVFSIGNNSNSRQGKANQAHTNACVWMR